MPFMSGFTMLLPSLLCLSALFLMPTTGEVHNKNFNPCLKFFLDKKPPDEALTPNKPARICQWYGRAFRFATLYDRERRIPIYSAYKFSPGVGERHDDWYVEPQLANPSFGRSMEDEHSPEIERIIEAIKASQAVSADYAASVFDRGHLNPVSHQPDQESKDATFTLTNVVPQNRALNNGRWNEYEDSVTERSIGCRDTYIITGVVPGKNYISDHRVNKPSHIWSAGCCVIDNNRRRSWAVLAENEEHGDPQDQSLRRLEKDLAKLYNKEIDLFHGSCYNAEPTNLS